MLAGQSVYLWLEPESDFSALKHFRLQFSELKCFFVFAFVLINSLKSAMCHLRGLLHISEKKTCQKNEKPAKDEKKKDFSDMMK